MASLGQELKRERELRAVSLKEIAGLTKISVRYLQALEEDQLDMLPGTFFVKGVLRAYSKCIGIEEDYFLNKYHEEVLLRETAQDKERKRRGEIPPELTKKESWLHKPRVLLPVVGLAVLAGAYVFIVKPLSSPQRDAVVSLPPARQSLIPALPPLILPLETSEEEGLRLDIFFVAETWIRITADDEVLIEGIKQAGEHLGYIAKNEFVLHIGNAGGMEYAINGRQGKTLGLPGAVKSNIKINRDNFSEYLLTSADKDAVEKSLR
jgi:cytoskeletal protein RodZ